MIDQDVGERMRYGFYRAQSLTLWFETFAAVCGLGISFILMSAAHGLIKLKVHIYILLILLFFSIIVTGSRSMMIMGFILSSIPLLELSLNYKRIFIIMPVIIVSFIALNQDLFTSVYDSIIYQDEFNGSSTDMRTDQLTASLFYWSQSPIIGHGPGQLAEFTHVNSDLWGGESIVFSTLVNYGILGAFALLFLYGQIIYYLIKIGKIDLCVFPIGFFVGKILTMLPGMGEAYIILYLIPFIFFSRKKLSGSTIH